MYKPPFNITSKMLSLSISITEKLGMISEYHSLRRMPILRKNNKIKSIHSSLAIEANSLSLNQVKDVIEGSLVLGPKKEIQEVKNAYRVYNMMSEFDCYKEKDLLDAHKILMHLIDEEAGCYRNHGEGVFDGDRVIFVAPSEKLVSSLMNDLFHWLKNDIETPLLIKSCVFHYEFVFIHPFGDGNGRMARLWQNIILCKWNKVFEYIPIESQIKTYQEDYYTYLASGKNKLEIKYTYFTNGDDNRDFFLKKTYYWHKQKQRPQVTETKMHFVLITEKNVYIGVDYTHSQYSKNEMGYMSGEDCIKANIDGMKIIEFAEPTITLDLFIEEPKEPKVRVLRFID